jgi:hypothetical protein
MAAELPFDAVYHFGRSLQHFGQATLELFPTLIVPFAFLYVSMQIVDFSEDSKRVAPFEVFFFCVLGVVAAYIGHFSREGFVSHILPGAIAALVVVFQLLGLTVDKLTAPLSTKKILLAASGSGLCYIVAARYFRLTFGGGI